MEVKRNKHILLATVGGTAQVVTETLYAMHKEGSPWPDEIYLITTKFGKNKSEQSLPKYLSLLCAEINQPLPKLSAETILVVPDANGDPVDDARSIEDHEALADFIVTIVRNFTSVSEQTIHASLAGGRKTMTFYLGYAMSMFGRLEDKLSHVLISEAYETNPDFWFPTENNQYRYIKDRAGNALDAAVAKVTLAEIPFVRHRSELPRLLLNESSSVRFRDLVRLINLGDTPEALHVCVDLPKRRIQIFEKNLNNQEKYFLMEITPNILELAFYAMMARASVEENKTVTRPKKDGRGDKISVFFFNEMLPIVGLPKEERSVDAWDVLSDWNELKKEIPEKTLLALGDEDKNSFGITQSWFDSRKNYLKDVFSEKLPVQLVRCLTPEIIYTENSKELKSPGGAKGGGYGIPLPKESIEIIECF